MRTYLVRRVLATVIMVWVVATAVFVVLRVTSDPAAVLIPAEATAEHVAAVRERLGVDQPLLVQYRVFLTGIITGKMAPSYRHDQPAMELVFERALATIQLAASALILATVVALVFGVVSAIYRDTFIDYSASFVSFLGFAVPNFWLGIMLILVFGVQLGVLPTSGSGTLRHLILPTVTLAMWPMGQLTRLVRSEMLEVLSQDYIRTARGKGLRESLVVTKHGLRNALIPVVTLLGLLVGSLLSGAVVVETIFAWPGVGRLLVDATLARDFPVIEAGVLFVAILFGIINLMVDIIYGVLDPRIRYG